MTTDNGRAGPIWLVRHASTTWTGRRYCGRRDVPLSSRGIEEAEALATRLARVMPADVVVLTSPATRARETAERIVAFLPASAEIAVDERLAEVDFGRAEGLSFEELATTLPDIAAGIAAGRPIDWPAGETAAAVADRARDVWLDITRDRRPRLAVTHGGFMRALLGNPLGGSRLEDTWIGPGAVIELGRVGGLWRLVTPPSAAIGVA